ncbi:MAG: NAD regulator [Caulobacterales bacterium]|nr:NAD regulator [Caulobacterales bacterium]
MEKPRVAIELSAVVMAPLDGETAVLTVHGPDHALSGLPAGPFDPASDRTFELALRSFVARQTGLAMGFVEQLYTFGDAGRETPQARAGVEGDDRVVSIGYLALAPAAKAPGAAGAIWCPWSDAFPYEDWRDGRPAVIDEVIAPWLTDWAGDDPMRRARIDTLFALNDRLAWRDERVLERYELLYETGLAPEAARDQGQPTSGKPLSLGLPLQSDHRRILATGLGRLRGKLRYRPVIFDLLGEEFTLSQLQKAVEAVIGQPLHKQNFRRGVERAGLVERTGRIDTATGGRPAELFRRRREAGDQAQTLGLSLPIRR